VTEENATERRNSLSEHFIDFKEIKQRVSIEDVLGHFNIRLRRVNQNSLRGACPLPTHQSETSKESFSVHTGKNIWACQSNSCAANRHGKKGGNVLDFTAVMMNSSIRDAALKLHEWFVSVPVVKVPEKGSEAKEKLVAEKIPGAGSEEINKPLTFTLKDIDHSHVYLRDRGLKEATLRHFGVGYFPGRGSMSGRVVIPIHNDKGELIAYAGRGVDGSEPKYKFPVGFKKSATLFNLHRVREALALAKDSGWERDMVIVVEGFFGCMQVWQSGLPAVVALMGSSMSDEQEEILRTFKQVILFLDGDEAGREATSVIASRLMKETFVRVINLPDGKQPDDLAPEEIKTILGFI